MNIINIVVKDDNKINEIINILKKYKSDIIEKIEVIDDKEEIDLYQKISNSEFSKIWDNKEDSVYDRYLSI